MQSYEASLAWLYALQPRGIRLELDRMREACARRGHPERKLRVVHVAGTNGKGSTSAMIAAIARASGQHVGLYTSPHLHSFRERIQIDGVPLSKEEVVTRVQAIRAMLEEPGAPELTFFEVTTLLAFEAFAERDLDLVVLEVGLGFAVDLKKPGGFLGKEHVVRQKEAGPLHKRLVSLKLAVPNVYLFHGEVLRRDGKNVGVVRSASYGHTVGGAVALAMVEPGQAVTPDFLATGTWEVVVGNRLVPASVSLKPFYDPESKRIRL